MTDKKTIARIIFKIINIKEEVKKSELQTSEYFDSIIEKIDKTIEIFNGDDGDQSINGVKMELIDSNCLGCLYLTRVDAMAEEACSNCGSEYNNHSDKIF